MVKAKLYVTYGLSDPKLVNQGIPGKKNTYSVSLVTDKGEWIVAPKYSKDTDKVVSYVNKCLGEAVKLGLGSNILRVSNPSFYSECKAKSKSGEGNLCSTLEEMVGFIGSASRVNCNMIHPVEREALLKTGVIAYNSSTKNLLERDLLKLLMDNEKPLPAKTISANTGYPLPQVKLALSRLASKDCLYVHENGAGKVYQVNKRSHMCKSLH